MSNALQDKLKMLKQRYRASFPDKLAEFSAARALLEAGDADSALEKFRHCAHKLAGSGASYGFTELSAQARRVEHAAIELQQSGSTDFVVLLREYEQLETMLKA